MAFLARQVQIPTGGLPAGYTRLDYIQSSGTQYINTLFAPNQDTRVVADMQGVGSAGSYFAFGARESVASNSFCVMNLSGTWNVDYKGYENRSAFSGVTFTDRVLIDFNKNVCHANDKTLTFTAATFQAPVPLFIFAANTNGTAGSLMPAKLYSCQIYDNGTLIRDFVPCKNANNVYGLYDLVNKGFYSNAGSGSFTGG